MTYKELKAKATPGKWFAVHGKGTCFHQGNLDSVQVSCDKDGDEEIVQTIAEVWPTGNRKQAKADAKLIAHCCHHFDALLEALREAKSALQHHGFYGDATTADAALAAAQEVTLGGTLGAQMSEPHKVSEIMSRYDDYRQLQVAKAKLTAITTAKNKAVEALKRANSILEDEYPATDCRHPRQWRLDKLIAELEAV